MENLHFSLPVHDLLGGEQHPQPGGGDLFQRRHVDGQGGHAVQRRFQLLFQLRRRGGVQSPSQGDGQFGCVGCFLNVQHVLSSCFVSFGFLCSNSFI